MKKEDCYVKEAESVVDVIKRKGTGTGSRHYGGARTGERRRRRCSRIFGGGSADRGGGGGGGRGGGGKENIKKLQEK